VLDFRGFGERAFACEDDEVGDTDGRGGVCAVFPGGAMDGGAADGLRESGRLSWRRCGEAFRCWGYGNLPAVSLQLNQEGAYGDDASKAGA
jgi:hypothetical protein